MIHDESCRRIDDFINDKSAEMIRIFGDDRDWYNDWIKQSYCSVFFSQDDEMYNEYGILTFITYGNLIKKTFHLIYDSILNYLSPAPLVQQARPPPIPERHALPLIVDLGLGVVFEGVRHMPR
jgi:hypothetical protein